MSTCAIVESMMSNVGIFGAEDFSDQLVNTFPVTIGEHQTFLHRIQYLSNDLNTKSTNFTSMAQAKDEQRKRVLRCLSESHPSCI